VRIEGPDFATPVLTHNFHHLMRDLSLHVDLGRMTETEAATQVARSIQQALGCARVNFWNVSGEIGQRVMSRVTGYDGRANRVLAEPLDLQETTGAFFKQLYDTGCYVCADTSNDPNLRDIFRTYLQPTAGMTMIVAAFHVDARVWGLISCVHDAPRRWTAAEITALRKCASELSRRRAQLLGS
jgi:GAF domain-containing protein